VGFMASFVLVLLGCPLFAQSKPTQSVNSATPPQTFHIRGTITDPLEAVIQGAKVTFQNELMSKAVTTNDVGVYEADLPFASYTMTATSKGFRMYRRPLFCVVSPTDGTIDVSLSVGKSINIVERPATPEEVKAAVSAASVSLPYYGEESFLIPSSGGVPYKLLIRYTKGERTNDTHDYTGEKAPYDDPVFVAYNLLSLRADHVIYNVKQHILSASGNVSAADGSGVSRRVESITVKIENGEVNSLP